MGNSSASSWFRSLDTAQRAAEIVAVLGRFGFGEVLRETGLDKFLRKSDKSGPSGNASAEPLPVRMRLLLEALGPTFIKAGQIMSTRPDLIPAEWADEFSKLQSDVPPAPWEGDDGVKSLLEEELGERLESEFEHIEETSLAAASMAQVHRAKLTDGRQIVLKVLRPGIREQMAADLELMRVFGRLTHAYIQNLGFDAQAVVNEFSTQLERETDLTIEAQSTQRMRRDFLAHPGITFPIVYEQLCTRSVLALEEVEGTLLARLDLEAVSPERRDRIVRNAADAVFQQCLVIGFFHADPHPGNIFVLDDENLCFIDCGMTGLVDPATITQLAQIVHGAVSGDLRQVVKVAIRITDADPGFAENRAFRTDVWQFVDRFQGGSLESIRMGQLLNDFFAILRKYRLRCPADIVYLIKALTTIEGVGGAIAPKFDLVAHVRPYVERLVKQRFSLAALKDRVEGAAVAYGDLVEELPGEISDLLKSIRQRRIGMQLEHRGLDQLTTEIEHASMNISWSLVIGAIICGSAVLILADSIDRNPSYLSTVALVGFIIAVMLGLLRVVRLRRPKKK